MNSPATALPPGRSRLALIVAGVLALLGSFVVTAPAQAGYYEDSYYGSNPCSYRCGYPRYRLRRPAIATVAPRAAVTGAAVRLSIGPCLRASLRRTRICRAALWLRRLPPSLRLLSVRGAAAATATIRTGAIIDPARGAMAMAVSGAAGQRRFTDINRPPRHMRSRRGRQRRFTAGTATKPILMATKIETTAKPSHTINIAGTCCFTWRSRRVATAAAQTVGKLASGLLGSLNPGAP